MHSSQEHHAILPSWDGHLLELRAPAECQIGVWLDGSRFSELRTDLKGHAGLELPNSPSGRPRLRVAIHVPGDADGTATQAFSIEIGKTGVLADAELPVEREPLHPIGKPLPANAQPMQPDVAIIVPVYNAAAAVKRCLDSVLAHSTGRCRLIVIDDASTDPEIAPILEIYRGLDGVEIHSNPANLGFTATVNRGMSLAGQADVVLLNADTEVASQWLTGLRRAAYSRADIATATAVSDNAGAFSVPELERENPLPSGWTFTQTARAHWQSAGHAYPQLPTGNGFCMYIRRSVLDQVGLFDVEAFPQGYGEENDFCQRACAAGFRHVIAGNVLVLHARSQSFGAERREVLGRAGMQVLRTRWPNYESDVGRQLFSFERRVLDWRVRRIHSLAASHSPLPRVLRYCANTDPAAEPGYELRMLKLNGSRLEIDGRSIEEWEASSPSTFKLACIASLLEEHAIELLEIEQGMDPGLTAELQVQSERLGVPMMSLASGEPATFAQRQAARKSLHRFKGPAR